MVIQLEEADTFSTQEVCRMFDIAKQTLYGWEKRGVIPAVAKDWRGWRIYDRQHIMAIREIIEGKREKTLIRA